MPGVEVVQGPAAGQPLVLGAGGRARVRYWIAVGLLAALYYAAAHLGYALEFAGPVAAIVWLPAGVAIAFLYLGGLRLWPGVVAGDLLVNNYSALPLGSALGQTCGNLLEVLTAAVLMRRLVRRGSPLDSVGNLSRLLVALGVGTAVSATVGALALRLGDVIRTGAIPEVWRTWWLGDFTGALVLVPLALAWWRPIRRPWGTGRAFEATLMLITVAALTEVTFHGGDPITYLVFPALIWAALRFGQRGATLAITLSVGLAVWDTTHYDGPFVFHSITHSVLSTQLFIAVAALSTLSLAAVVCEREEFAQRLRASRARLVEAADTERRRIEHNLHDGAQQRLTAVVLHLRLAADRTRTDPQRAGPLFEAAEAELQLAIDEVRELARGIHPAVLVDRGLAGAVEDLAARATVPTTVIELPARRADRSAEATAYYVVAEAMTNAHKHAGASRIRVRARLASGMLLLDVDDDGAGGAVEGAGSGLQGLRDRVEAVGGTFDLRSAPGAGTSIAVAIPATADGR